MMRFELRHSEQAYLRNALFAVELLDAVTLERLTDGVEIVADGLRGKPTINTSGLFVWRREDLAPLTKISIDPGRLPYERLDVPRAQLTLPPAPRPITRVQLSPRADYPFDAGTTVARGVLIERDVIPRVPVTDANVSLRWLDEDGVTWRDSAITSSTSAKGDFVSPLRLSPVEIPQLDGNGALTVRVRARRGADTRVSTDLKLPQGRVADPSTLSALIVAWEAMQS